MAAPRQRREKTTVNPVVAAAKRRHHVNPEPVQLSTGYWVIVKPISVSVIADVQAGIKDPPVPEWYNEEKGRAELNPNDPAYQQALRETDALRNIAVTDAMILFGLELVDENGNAAARLPLSEWLPKLQFLQKRGTLDLSSYDTENELDLDFMFKKYVVVGAPDLITVMGATGLTEEEIARARQSFPNNS